jgi:hypothetical protein
MIPSIACQMVRSTAQGLLWFLRPDRNLGTRQNGDFDTGCKAIDQHGTSQCIICQHDTSPGAE